MSYPMDIERRIQEILHRQNGRAVVCRSRPAPTLVFLIGLLVGLVVATVCAPLHSAKIVPHRQPWQIQYATSDEH